MAECPGGESKLLVSKIREGTVIDHIPAGRALAVLKLLNPPRGARVALVMNAESRKLGRKDIVKVEGVTLTPEQTAAVALIAPKATINIIKNYDVVEKRRATPPRTVKGILRCTNPTCITRKPGEPVKPKFKLVKEEPVTLQCIYCGTIITQEEIVEQLSGQT
ncbi:aspartate carbamoyltransferase regulatory subunit [Stetteria hydrogenophila]